MGSTHDPSCKAGLAIAGDLFKEEGKDTGAHSTAVGLAMNSGD